MLNPAPYYTGKGVTVLCGDVRQMLQNLADKSVQCCVTSPPFYGLRDYGHPDQIGLEATPDCYIAELLAVFREVWRVLRDDGTLWLNLGDSYAGGGGYSASAPSSAASKSGKYGNAGALKSGGIKPQGNIKPKDLLMIPARVALALQADGWYLRKDIIWCKKAPMPESVTDRPTSAHEHIFLLSKSARYFYDAAAVREKTSGLSGGGFSSDYAHSQPAHGAMTLDRPADNGTRNLWDYWLLSPENYSSAHFATFNSEIPRRAIKAGTSEYGCCAECGAGYRRITKVSRSFESGSGRSGNLPNGKNGHGLQGGGETLDIRRGSVVHTQTLGWQPTCNCGSACGPACGGGELVPCTVLDPFGGSGTTAMVAMQLMRKCITVELNPDYCELIKGRIEAGQPDLFNGPATFATFAGAAHQLSLEEKV